MYDILTQDEHTKSFLVSGTKVKFLRKRLKIGFNKFCFKAGISTRTLANIEKSESIIVKAETMRSLMVGFNLTRNGMRSRPILHSAFSRGAYTIAHPQLLATDSGPKKMTVYINRDTRTAIEAFAKQNNLSENQAIVEATRNYLGVVSSSPKFCRNISSFDILSPGAL